MTDPDLVDRLAEWCRLSERGWRRDSESGVLCEPEWVRDVPGGVRVWRPLDSDDDCRVVMERFYEVADWGQINGMYYEMSGSVRGAILASPREKCEAVLRVLGDA